MLVTRECASFLYYTDNDVAGGPADNGHSPAMTRTNGRGLEASSTDEAPEIIVTAPRDDGNEPVCSYHQWTSLWTWQHTEAWCWDL